MNYLELISHSITPLVILVLGIIYKGLLEKIVTQFQSLKVLLPGIGEIKLSSAEAEKKLSELFSEFYLVYHQLLNDDDKRLFREILKWDKRSPPAIKELIPEFSREDEKQLGMLRSLRGLGLITPAVGRNWEVDSQIQVTKFGQTLTSYFKNHL